VEIEGLGTSMNIICGADGCKAGWVVIFKDLDSGNISWHLCRTARELAYGEPIPQIIALDIPIGLPDRGSRLCDCEARRLLGPGRASSVFPAPIRPVLAATSYDNACQIGLQVESKKLSRQAWAILPKIRDVDETLRQDVALQTRIREVHPEVCFYFLAEQHRLQHGKKHKAGREERRKLLEPLFNQWLAAVLADRSALTSAEDDILDAFVALWTAERIVSGTSQSIPSVPPRDTFGLRMEIVA
jgi:predicted RNase H-like nuclease